MILDGKKVSNLIINQVKEQMRDIEDDVTLAIVSVGKNPASEIYIRNKMKMCQIVGINCIHYHNNNNHVVEDSIVDLIVDLNRDPRITGILVQLPLPEHINEKRVIETISPLKDVDGFSNYNIGRLWAGDSCVYPCTPDGIITLLEHYGINVSGKHCVIIGRSNIVGKPLAAMMLQKNATVTVCHSKTENLEEITRQADILISAAGAPKFITADMIKQDAIVVDVGINYDEDGHICGDVDFDTVCDKASYISPVPGGVGPMTVAKLMQRVLITKKLQEGKVDIDV